MSEFTNPEGAKSYVSEYLALRKEKSRIEARMKEIGETLKKTAVEYGTKNSSGSSYYEGTGFVIGNQCKKRVTLNQDKATDFLKHVGLYDKVKETKEFINEDKLEQLIANGELAPEDLEGLVDVKVSYAIDIKEVETPEEMPTIETQVKKTKKLPKRKVK